MTISVFSMLEIIILARALYVAADLNIAEHLAHKPMTVYEIAESTGSNSSALERLMFFLETQEVFKKDDSYYSLTEFSETMRGDHPQSIKSFLLHDDETRWNSFGHLGYSIKTGKASFDHLYGMDYFAHLKQHEQLNYRFNEAMTRISAVEDALIAQAMPFEKTVVDIGGGVGQLINAIAHTNVIERGILFDLPEVVAQAPTLHSCCTTQAGSFFSPFTIDADIFILKRILHDWDDAQALEILKNVAQSMSNHSKLYIFEGVLDLSPNKKLLASLNLALLTIFKGKERTQKEFEDLFHQAGLGIISIKALNDLICIIECQKIN